MARRRVGKGESEGESRDEAAEPEGAAIARIGALVDAAAPANPTQRDLRALADTLAPVPPAELDAALDHALDARRAEPFTALLFARLHLGHPVDAELLRRGATLLPSSEALAAAAGRLAGDVGRVLVDVVRVGQLGWEAEPSGLLVAALWARRRGVPMPEGLLAQARACARRQLTAEGEEAVLALQALLDDPDLGSLVAFLDHPDVKEAARALAGRLVDRLIGEPLDVFPERATRGRTARRPVRRAVEKVGRNDLCPCGSGKKYKQCHEAADRARLAESSDVAGLTAGELGRELERHLTADRIGETRGAVLARLDPRQVPVELRTAWIDALGQWCETDAAEQAIRAWWPADGAVDDLLDDLVRRVVEFAVHHERLDVSRRLVALRGGIVDDLLLEARLALCDPAERLAVIEAFAVQELDHGGIELGHGLLGAGLRGLGIHVARAQLVLRHPEQDGAPLYGALLEARDALLAPAWDPIDDVLYTLEHGVTPDVDRELATARARVQQSETSLSATREALESLREELEQREAEVNEPRGPEPTSAAAPAAAPRDDEAVRELRERLEHLKSELKDRHRERNTLRRELDHARAQVADLEKVQREEPAEASDDDEDDEIDGGLDVSVAARIRVPVLPDGFDERLRVVPEATARAALVRLGELCAGFDTAFREVRPLRGFDGVWRVKIGRSYRLLFKPSDHHLEVVDLLHRQDLEKRLFRLRRGGEG